MKVVLFIYLLITTMHVYGQALPDGINTSPALPQDATASPTMPDGMGTAVKDNSKNDVKESLQPKNKYERKATDLILFPNYHEFIFAAGVHFFSSTSQFNSDAGELYKFDYSGRTLELNGLYALNENFALGLRLASSSSKEEIKYGTGSTKSGTTTVSESKGFEDAVFALVYRAMDVSRDRYDMNISLLLSPKIQEAKGAAESKNGNVAKGRDEYSFLIEWGRRNLGNSWAFGLEISTIGDWKSKDASNGDETKINSYSTLGVTGDYQWSISPNFSIELNLGLSSTGAYKVTYYDGSYLDVESVALFKIGTTANILIGPKTYLVVSIAGLAAGDRNLTDKDGNQYVRSNNTSSEIAGLIVKQF